VTLQAFDASNLQHQLVSIQAGTWTHAVNSNADIVPTVANGKVYVASNKQVQIFGLLAATHGQHRAVERGLQPSKPDQVSCPRSEPALAAVAGGASAKHQLWGTVCHLEGSQLQLTLRSGRSISIDVSAAFTKHRPLVLSPGRAIRIVAGIDAKGVARAERISPSHALAAYAGGSVVDCSTLSRDLSMRAANAASRASTVVRRRLTRN
jgi:hypothetical protein